MSVLVGTGHVLWSGLYVIVSTLGLVITVYLLNFLYIKPYNIYYWWYKGLLLVACMTISVVLFGGIVIGLWHIWERKTSYNEECENSSKTSSIVHPKETRIHKKTGQEQYLNIIRYGQRPDFSGMFQDLSLFYSAFLSLSSFCDGKCTLPVQSYPANPFWDGAWDLRMQFLLTLLLPSMLQKFLGQWQSVGEMSTLV